MKTTSRKKAFTLIELLVVIAIISLLVSILLPSLQQARELAKTAVCLTNYRQISVGSSMYLVDCNDRYPVTIASSSHDYAPDLRTWQSLLLPYFDGGDIGYANPRGQAVLNFKLFLCPSRESENIYTTNAVAFGCSANLYLGGASLPSYSDYRSDRRPGISSTDLTNLEIIANAETGFGLHTNRPLSVVLENYEDGLYRNLNTTWQGGMTMTQLNHPESTNILWVDGHASNEDEDRYFEEKYVNPNAE